MNNKIISVIMPTYNRRDFICKAIDSVLNQNYKYVEIIVIDDKSTDGTIDLLKEKYNNIANLFIFQNVKNSGAGFSRKVGYSKSKGEFFVFMDDDDYYTNFEFFEKAIKILDKMENVGFVSSSSKIEYIKEKKIEDSIMNISGLIKKEEYLSEFQLKYMKSNSTFTTVFRKKALESAGFGKVDMVNDSSIYLRALISSDAYILNEISGVYRVHSKNITNNLKVSFIIENLNEKKNVYNEIIERNLINDADEWLKKQILLTTTYWIENNDVNDQEFVQLIKWCENNCKKYSKVIIDKLIKLRW